MMKIKYLLLLFITTFIACHNSSDSEDSYKSKLVLEEFDYFENDIPFSSNTYDNVSNHDEVAALGRLLFYDNALSQNNSISCASCHKQSLGFSDNEAFSIGLKNYETTRNSMSLVNNAYQRSHFWEGHTGKIDDHILNPISNHLEMGMRNIEELVEKLSEINEYNDLFVETFGQEISEKLISTALSTFVASIISYNSKFDKGVVNGFTNFTIAEQEGKDLFFGEAKCSKCHGGSHFSPTWSRNANIGLDMEYQDQGAGNGKFKIPSLRNIGLTAPYMHDGRFQSLEEVVDHYVNGIKAHPNLDWIFNDPIVLTEQEQNHLVEFLHTLTDYQLISDKKFSNPF